MGRLGLALNAMLARIESSFRAQEASERKLRRFVADASHELRTPLTAVRAYAELYDRGAADRPDDLERSMRGISRESERMSVLVEDLLLLARLDDGRPLEREPVQLDEVVGEAVETAQTVDPDRPIDSTPSRRSSSATATGCVRSSTTCSRTSAPTRLPGRRRRSRSHAATGRRRSPSRTSGRVSTRSTSSTCSSASTAPTPRAPARAAASAWGSRSSPPSRRLTGERCPPRRARARARRSLSHCRSHPSRAPERPQPIHRQLTEPAQSGVVRWMRDTLRKDIHEPHSHQISARRRRARHRRRNGRRDLRRARRRRHDHRRPLSERRDVADRRRTAR